MNVQNSTRKDNLVAGPGATHRCVMAAALANPLFRQRKIKSAKAYRRQPKHKTGRWE